jgi:hypothetical protein
MSAVTKPVHISGIRYMRMLKRYVVRSPVLEGKAEGKIYGP